MPLILVLFFGINAFAREKDSCEEIFVEKPDHYRYSREEQAETFLEFRESAADYWDWLKDQTEDTDTYKQLFKFYGPGSGDAHILNFGFFERSGGRLSFGLIDFDGIGNHVPYLGDFLRFAISAQLLPHPVSFDKLWSVYSKAVVDQQVRPMPKFIRTQLSRSRTELEEVQEKHIKGLTKKSHDRKGREQYQFDYNDKLTRVRDAKFKTQWMFGKLKQEFKHFLRDYELLDVGVYTKDSGGSKNVPRFWYLVRKNNKVKIIEFRWIKQPPAAEWEEQSGLRNRFHRIVHTYFNSHPPAGFLGVVEAEDKEFLVQEKLFSPVSFDPFTEDGLSASEAEEVVLYLANKLGRAVMNEDSKFDRLVSDPNTPIHMQNLMYQYLNRLR